MDGQRVKKFALPKGQMTPNLKPASRYAETEVLTPGEESPIMSGFLLIHCHEREIIMGKSKGREPDSDEKMPMKGGKKKKC